MTTTQNTSAGPHTAVQIAEHAHVLQRSGCGTGTEMVCTVPGCGGAWPGSAGELQEWSDDHAESLDVRGSLPAREGLNMTTTQNTDITDITWAQLSDAGIDTDLVTRQHDSLGGENYV